MLIFVHSIMVIFFCRQKYFIFGFHRSDLVCDVEFLQKIYRKKADLTMNVSQLPENVPKNRYRDIAPCKLSYPTDP